MQAPLSLKATRETNRVRYSLRFFGVTLSRSVYHLGTRPTSGAALKVHESYWIATKKRAFGYGRVQDWAVFQYLELSFSRVQFYGDGFKAAGTRIEPPIAGSITTVHGLFESQPAVVLESRTRTYIHIKNRNPVSAFGVLMASGLRWGTSPLIHRYSERRPNHESCQPRVVTYAFECAAGKEKKIDMNSPTSYHIGTTEDDPIHVFDLDRESRLELAVFVYNTLPTGSVRWGRIHGRPEWDANL